MTISGLFSWFIAVDYFNLCLFLSYSFTPSYRLCEHHKNAFFPHASSANRIFFRAPLSKNEEQDSSSSPCLLLPTKGFPKPALSHEGLVFCAVSSFGLAARIKQRMQGLGTVFADNSACIINSTAAAGHTCRAASFSQTSLWSGRHFRNALLCRWMQSFLHSQSAPPAFGPSQAREEEEEHFPTL